MPEPIARPEEPAEDFGACTPWTAGAAAVFTLFTLGMSILAATLTARLGGPTSPASTPEQVAGSVNLGAVLTLLIMQAVIIALVWWGAGRFGADRRRLLSLPASGLPLSAFLFGLGCMIALLVPVNLVVWLLWPQHFLDNMQTFWELARSQARWLAAIAFTIGAPLSEELLFRGFLLPALCKTRFGFAGAAVISSAAWTALHFYTIIGLVEVFLIGLFFAWLMKRYGNLWLPLALHALYNGLQFVVLALWPVAS